MKRSEIEDDICCSVSSRGNISRILKECPLGFEFIVVNNK